MILAIFFTALFFGGIITSIIFASKKDNDYPIPLFLGLLFLLILLGFVHSGMYKYPKFVARRNNLLTLQEEYKKRTDTIYTLKSKRGFGGVIYSEEEKTNQEKMLRELFLKIANGKSIFNAELSEQQLKLTISFYKLLGNECFIDKRLLDIKPLK